MTSQDGPDTGRVGEPSPDAAFSAAFPLVVAVSLIAVALTERFEALPGAIAAFTSAYLLLREP
ncbi:hypothetical protein [Nocardioides sp. Soil805]|uniref:hypothetical protein n=1 Tax=Nocardioides sp. Soil805 TaxID=1736416 RepID=UPI000702A216|nr:hypothetical protein [Nocardioides sp. Soil805]KRF30565.1 hypothetical protein ASG94_18710 [Nocardioides sp. Soil805]